jgi:hypothetical protein
VVAAAAVVLLVAGVGGFYAYQKRNNADKVDGPAIQQISTPTNTTGPTAGESAASTDTPEESRQVADEKRQIATEEGVIRKQEKATKQRMADKQEEDRVAAEEADRARAEGQSRHEHPAQPQIPEVNPVDVPRPRQPSSTRRVGDVIIRNFPDGTQVIISPDGSRVIVAPDGRRQVIRPGQRINRRRIPPRL